MPPDRPAGTAETIAVATTFLRVLRDGLDQGLELPEAVVRSTGVLPSGAKRALNRLDGRYIEDEWGFDEDFAQTVEPLFDFLYDHWWRVRATGVEKVPAHGRVLLAGNHAGILPWDATMMSIALLREHPLPRYPRFLVLDWAFQLPWVSTAIRKVGGVVASPYNALRLLEDDQLVAVFPEGVKGTGKPLLRALSAAALRPRRLRGAGAAHRRTDRAGGRRGQRGDLPDDRPVRPGRARAARALLPAHPHLPLAGPAGHGPAAVEVADRVLRPDPDRALRPRRGERPHACARALGAGPLDHPAEGLREPGGARRGVWGGLP